MDDHEPDRAAPHVMRNRVVVYRGSRDFTGPYVAHCHDPAHQDHAMMFGWTITP